VLKGHAVVKIATINKRNRFIIKTTKNKHNKSLSKVATAKKVVA
jgi:hypothetical protein